MVRLDNERVAALHDGRLDARERDEVLMAVLADDFEYDVFAETAAVLRELEDAHGASPAVNDVADGEATPPRKLETPAPDAPDGVEPVATVRPDGGVISLDAWRSPPPAEASGPIAETPALEGGTPPTEGVIPINSRRKRPGRTWAYGAIAAGIAAIGLTFAVLNRPVARLDDPERAAAMLKGVGVAVGWEDPWRNTTRGAADTQYSEQALAVRLGAHLTSLEFAAASRDTAAIGDLTRRISFLSRNAGGGGIAASVYDSIGHLAATGQDVRPLLADGRESIRIVLLPENWFELGVWGETARNAAASTRHDADFFRSRTTRAVLDRAGKIPDLDESVSSALTTVRNDIRDDGAPDWPKLQKDIVDLLRVAGR